jgi:hypothetical protein
VKSAMMAALVYREELSASDENELGCLLWRKFGEGCAAARSGFALHHHGILKAGNSSC